MISLLWSHLGVCTCSTLWAQIVVWWGRGRGVGTWLHHFLFSSSHWYGAHPDKCHHLNRPFWWTVETPVVAYICHSEIFHPESEKRRKRELNKMPNKHESIAMPCTAIDENCFFFHLYFARRCLLPALPFFFSFCRTWVSGRNVQAANTKWQPCTASSRWEWVWVCAIAVSCECEWKRERERARDRNEIKWLNF